MKRFQDAIDQGHVVLDLDASDIESAIRATVRRMVTDGIIPEVVADQVSSAL